MKVKKKGGRRWGACGVVVNVDGWLTFWQCSCSVCCVKIEVEEAASNPNPK
jgi:hypothetical protein